jgi:uncharacterized membrane protein
MNKKRKLIIALLILVGVFFAYATWYKLEYSMDVVSPYEVNVDVKQKSLLIATQGSEFKEAIVKRIVEHYEAQPIYIKVTDVTNLDKENESDWDAILVLHTWEYDKPQPDAEAFLNKIQNQDKIVVLTTSGNHESKMEEVDAITGASIIKDVPSKVDEIKSRLNIILQ